jgi:prevent-host-death family protein
MAWAKAREQARAKGSPKLEENLDDLLKEDPQLSNVTELRNNLLPVIERFEKNPALRIMILKHGKPQAVLMSAQTYELVKKVMNRVTHQLEPASKEEAVKSARARLREERQASRPAEAWDPSAAATMETMHAQMQLLMQALKQFSNDLNVRTK